MGFAGLIVSDDLFMKGIAAKWTLEEAAERFFRAGGDLLLLCHQESAQRRVAAHLVHLAERDSEFRVLLEAKSQRVEKIRNLLAEPGDPGQLEKFASAHRDLAEAFS
jgi:beta-N-acetylhexosaminidase